MTQESAEFKLGTIKRVAVIGSGPCGSAVVKSFLGQKSFDNIVAFERRSTFGGLWNYYNENYNNQSYPVPSLNPHQNLLTPFKLGDDETKGYIWPSAAYEILDTNVPKDIMTYKDHPWPEGTPLYPTREDVLNYMQSYAEGIRDYVRFSTNVVDVKQLNDGTWQVTSRAVNDKTSGGIHADPETPDVVEIYDAVIVSNGSYDLPFIPDRPGLLEWNEKYPNSISHSKSYRHTRQFGNPEGEILVIGNSASGSDLAYQFANEYKKKIYKSARSESKLASGTNEFIITVKDVEKFIPETKDVVFVDGTVLHNVDKIVFATGYLRHVPFLKEINESEKPVISNGERVEGLYRQCLSYRYPGLAFVTLPRHVLPTRLSEVQGSWLARIFSHNLKVPSIEEMAKDEQNTVEEKGTGPSFHNLLYPEDLIYAKVLYKEITEADKESGNVGFLPKDWDEHECILRGAAMVLKGAYLKYKEETGKLALSAEEVVNGTGLELPAIDRKLLGFE